MKKWEALVEKSESLLASQRHQLNEHLKTIKQRLKEGEESAKEELSELIKKVESMFEKNAN